MNAQASDARATIPDGPRPQCGTDKLTPIASSGTRVERAVGALKSVTVPVSIFLVSRGLLAVLAAIAPDLLPPIHTNRVLLPHSDILAHAWSWSSPWFRFDAGWYVGVAAHGYRWGSAEYANTNFLPLYPIAIRAVQPLCAGSLWLASWLVSNLAFLVALILLWKWSMKRWDASTSFRVLLLMVAFPFSFFYAAPYTEPLFLVCALATFLYADQDRWAASAMAAGLGAVTRPVGIALILALLVYAVVQRSRRPLLAAIFAIVPLSLFVAYLGIAFGHPTAFAVYHTYGWLPPHGGLVSTLASEFHTRLSPFDRIDAFVTVVFLASTVLVWRQLGAPYAIFVGAATILPLTRSLAGMERYVIVLFPVMAVWATWKNKAGQTAIFALSLVGLVFATTMFSVGYSLF